MATVHLIVLEQGGLHGAYVDADPERLHAKATLLKAVVVELPTTADYRNLTDEEAEEGERRLRRLDDPEQPGDVTEIPVEVDRDRS